MEELLAQPVAAAAPSSHDADIELAAKLAALHDRFCEAMDDDFNTALAIAHIFDLIRALNRTLAEKIVPDQALLELFSQVTAEISRIAGVLGVLDSIPADFLARIKSRKSSGLNISVEEIEKLVEERTAARKAKDFKRSDEIRDQLLRAGIELLDSAAGTEWKVK
jgi:cysteinyl-tRNA synthetase